MIHFNRKEKFYDIMQKAELSCRKKTAQQFCLSLSITGNLPHMQHRNGAGVWKNPPFSGQCESGTVLVF